MTNSDDEIRQSVLSAWRASERKQQIESAKADAIATIGFLNYINLVHDRDGVSNLLDYAVAATSENERLLGIISNARSATSDGVVAEILDRV